MTDAYTDTKPAFIWVYPIHPYCVGYPGVLGDLFFSSPEKFKELLGRELTDDDHLIPITVQKDFTDWDYIPENY